jgi:surface antigen-like variable number repeat protein
MKTLLILILLSLSTSPFYRREAQDAQGVHGDSAIFYQPSNSPCSQPVAEQSSLIRKAQKNKYLIRRIEFIGNQNTRDNVLRRRVLLQEGNVFKRAILVKSLARVSTLRMVYPVKLSDVVAHLNDDEKTIDVLICFKERRR